MLLSVVVKMASTLPHSVVATCWISLVLDTVPSTTSMPFFPHSTFLASAASVDRIGFSGIVEHPECFQIRIDFQCQINGRSDGDPVGGTCHIALRFCRAF